MKILIIEDETLAADKLERMIERYDEQHEIVDKLRSVEAATAWFEAQEAPDLLFLDIHLLDGTCFDILKAIDIPCPVIFTTAYDEYALEAFQLNSVDYLLKPISFARLEQAFHKLETMQQSFQQQQQVQQLNSVLDALQSQRTSYKTRFLVKSGARLFSVATEHARYFFSDEGISFLVTKDGKKYSINHTLDELEELLHPADFFRISRQMIVHIDSIKMVHKHFKGRLQIELQPSHEEEAMVSSRRVADFQAWLDR